MRRMIVLACVSSLAACSSPRAPSPRAAAPSSPSLTPAEAAPLVDPKPSASSDPCKDVAPTSAVLLGADGDMFTFYPSDATVTPIGRLQCPISPMLRPFSMALDRTGVAWVLFHDGYRNSALVRADTTRGLRCERTVFSGNESGFVQFGLAFANDPHDGRERLYIAQAQQTGDIFGAIDVETLSVAPLGHMKGWNGGELSGTGDGRLFGFAVEDDGKAQLFEVDRDTGAAKDGVTVKVGRKGDATAFVFWRGDFFLFTSSVDGITHVNRYQPSDGSIAHVNDLAVRIVGAGVSTCAR